MGPPGGGRNPITPRLLRHFNFLAYTEMEDISKKKIFGTIFHSWIGKKIKNLIFCGTIYSETQKTNNYFQFQFRNTSMSSCPMKVFH